MTSLKTLWSEAPWTLRTYFVVGLLLGVVGVVFGGGVGRWIALVVGVVLCYLLFRRVRWLWFLDIAYTAFCFVGFLLVPGTNAIFQFTGLVLLLAPPTRRHFAQRPVPVDG